MTNDKSSGLRPEAQPFEFNRLSQNQTKAVKELLKKLNEAVKALDEWGEDRKCEKPSFEIPISKKNHNRIAFLSGGRGSGKTSVLHTLIKLLGSDSGAYLKESKESEKNKIEEKLKEIKKRVIWLRPIQMETLPNSTNLLVAILSRINDAIDRLGAGLGDNHGYKADPFALNQDVQKTLSDFERLQRDVAMAWDGNLEQHAASMDPDTYAVEVLRVERNRFKLDEKLIKILDGLNEHLIPNENNKKSIFVLPIDDFDSSPHRSEHLVKLIHLTSVPYLFTVILGDIDITRNIFNQNIKKYLSSAGNDAAFLHVPLNNRIAHESSANAMRKLFPMSHIVELKPMTWKEVLDFKPKGKDESVKDLLDTMHVAINTRKEYDNQYVAGQHIQSLKDFLDIKIEDIVECESESESESGSAKEYKLKDMVYNGPALLSMYPRHVQDLWRYLKQKNDDGNDKDKYRFGKEFALKFFKQTASEDRKLSLEISDELLNSVRKDFSGHVQLDTEHMLLESLSGPGLRINKNKNEKEKRKSTITIRLPKDWICKIKIESQKHSEPARWVKISEDSSVAMMLLHDLIILSKPNGTIGPSLMKKHGGPCWAYTLWPVGPSGGIDVLWLTPPWRSLWAHDFMRRCWIKVWEWLNKHMDKKTEADALSELMAYYWIKTGTGVFKDTPGIEILIEKAKQKHDKTCNEESEKFNGLKTEIRGLIKPLSVEGGGVDEKIREAGKKKDKLDDIKKRLMDIKKRLMDIKKRLMDIKKDDLEDAIIEEIAKIEEMLNGGKKEKQNLVACLLYYNTIPFKLLHLPMSEKNKGCWPFVPSIENGAINMNDSWFWLISDILDLIKKDATSGARSENLLRGWMASIACLMAPESDLPKNVVKWFVNEKEIKGFWEKHDVAHEIRRLRAMSAVKFFNDGVIDKLYELYKPRCRETTTLSLTETQEKKLLDDDGGDGVNTMHELRPYMEDIVALSELPRTKKKDLEKKLHALLIRKSS
ncbi:MAG: hypothetical protein GY737_07750 [Desulfobacteraceae bacterium]|nr:hypothetical protein [Desulfobacteraceae bacterium]